MISHFPIIARDLAGNELYRDQGSTKPYLLGQMLSDAVTQCATFGEFHITFSANALKEKPK